MKHKTDEVQGDLEEDCSPDISPEKGLDKMIPASKDKEVLTDRNGQVSETNMDSKEKKMNGKDELLSRSAKVPVENGSDGEENGRENADEGEDLSAALSKCSLADKAKGDDDLVGKISNLRVSDEKEAVGAPTPQHIPNSPYTQKGAPTPQHIPNSPYTQMHGAPAPPDPAYTQVYPPTMTGTATPPMYQDLTNEFFDWERLTELKDTMETIANDMIRSYQNKQK